MVVCCKPTVADDGATVHPESEQKSRGGEARNHEPIIVEAYASRYPSLSEVEFADEEQTSPDKAKYVILRDVLRDSQEYIGFT